MTRALVAVAVVIAATPVLAEPMVAYRKHPTVAQSLVQCGPHDEIAAVLKKKFGERLTVQAISQRGNLVEVFVGPSGTWTLVETRPGGVACLRDGGTSWSVHPDMANRT